MDMNDDRKMEVIQQLMEELQGMMEPSADELGERLGRPKQVEVMKVGVGSPDEMPPSEDEDMPDGDDDMSSDPDEMLKQRLMKLRG